MQRRKFILSLLLAVAFFSFICHLFLINQNSLPYLNKIDKNQNVRNYFYSDIALIESAENE